LIYILTISWTLTLVSLILTPLIFIILSRVTSPIEKRSNALQEELGKLNGVAQDNINGVTVSRSFNLDRILEKRYAIANMNVVQKGLSIARVRSGVDVLSILVGFLPFIITMGYGGYLTITGVITFGSLFAFVNLLNYVVNPLSSLPTLVARISEGLGAYRRIDEMLDLPLERTDGRAVQATTGQAEIIRLDNVSFAYPGSQMILERISFSIKPGEKIAIVGPSGSGKSTLLKLLLGFFKVENGRIVFFGEEMNQWKLSAARELMAFVAQDTFLFPVSIAENITLGRIADSQAVPDQETIIKAAKAANIHDFIASLPDGYQTQVGERGARLSGGQRQRISLARAIYKNAPILLLDEPTSSLDSESESLVQEALDRLMAQSTSIVVAHRLSTIRNADRVFVLDAGKIVQEGSHGELYEQGGLYRELYDRQFNLAEAGGAA
jgi:ABC-type multidrug transport system fused ATPase/permease subunit